MEQYFLLMSLLQTNLECHISYQEHLMAMKILSKIIAPNQNAQASLRFGQLISFFNFRVIKVQERVP